MTIGAGTKLGPYEILDLLGTGGMSQVFRAKDTRLRRDVALKVLHSGFSDSDEAVRRFERETRAVAALNHPNIMAVHDVGYTAGVRYSVSEFLTGETLADRLRSGPIAEARAVEILAQIADGLAAAHIRGIVHRDIKPANIFLTADGRTKVMDFGIACFEPSTAGDSSALDCGGRLTAEFEIPGTAGYISPEQIRGRSADARSDIFALGAVAYEMLTGRKPFLRDTAVAMLDAVLSDRPETYPEAERIPAGLRTFIFRCLEKDPADRYQSARDLLFDLRAYQAEERSEAAARVTFRSEPPWKHQKTRTALQIAAGAVLFLLGILLGRGC